MRVLITVFCIIANFYCSGIRYCPKKCYCGSNLVSCKDATNPRFWADGRIITLIMERCYVTNLNDILIAFRNLEYIKFKNMTHFNCSQMDYISDQIVVEVDSCPDISSTTGKKKKHWLY